MSTDFGHIVFFGITYEQTIDFHRIWGVSFLFRTFHPFEHGESTSKMRYRSILRYLRPMIVTRYLIMTLTETGHLFDRHLLFPHQLTLAYDVNIS